MTNEKAIEVLKNCFPFNKLSITGKAKDVSEFVQAIEVGIKAIAMQIPEKPMDDGWPYCPQCGAYLDCTYKSPRCGCGQAIDWSEE